MKFKGYLFLARKSFFQKKVNIINILLMTLSIVLIVFVSSFSKTMTNFISNQVNNHINNRVLIVENKDNNLNTIISNYSFIASELEYLSHVKTLKEEEIILIGVPKDFIKVKDGSGLNNNNEMICPASFYLGNNSEEINEDFTNNLLEGNTLINESITLLSTNYKQDYKIVGTYDQNTYTYGEYNICFTAQSNIEKIKTEEYNQFLNECAIDNADCASLEENYNDAYIMLKDSLDIDKTIEILEEQGYLVTKLIGIDLSSIDFITNVFLSISIIICLIVFIIMLLTNNKFVTYNKKNNLIFKTLGYSDNILIKIGYLEAIIFSAITIFISLIIILPSYFYLNDLYAVEVLTGATITISSFSIILSCILVLAVSLLSQYISIKNQVSNSIIEGLSDNEI